MRIYRTYEVKNRQARPSRGGLALPLPPTGGPITLQQGNRGLLYRAMGQYETGNVPTHRQQGIWTDHISDCVVLFAVEWDGRNRRWTNFCWGHLMGGYNNLWNKEFCLYVNKPSNCFALIAAKYWTGTEYLADEMVKLGITKNRITIYISKQDDFGFGIRFFGGGFGEV